jgi:hypothetical protein
MTRCVGALDFGRTPNLPSTANAGTTDHMARSKKTPERSAIAREPTRAFARRQRTDTQGDKKTGDDEEADRSEEVTKVPAAPQGRAPAEAKSAAKAEPATPDDLPDITPPDPMDEPWPDATPPPMKPVEMARARTVTVAVPQQVDLGRPPDMPTTTAPPPLALGAVENPAHMPGPREIPGGEPGDAAPAPGTVPRGDSRSLRRGNEFALIYRVQTFVISRFGTIGTRGQWRVVEYPTSASASHAYAKEASRFVSEGFTDYRE